MNTKIALIQILVLALVITASSFIFINREAIGGTFINLTLTSNPTLEDGLVGHWTFDGPDMVSNVADRSGQGNHGALSGQTSTTTVQGVLGQALEFDGSDDYVNAGQGSTLDITGNITVSAWINADTSASREEIVGKGDNTYLLYIGSGNPSFFIKEGGTWNVVTANTGVSVDTWVHLVGTFDGTTVKLYVDNVLQTDTELASSINSVAADVAIGKNSEVSGRNFDGTIDDVRVYNRALSADEISRLYDLGATTYINKTITTNPDLESGLVGHWTFDGPDMVGNIADRSSNNNDGILLDQNPTTTVIGRIGQALEFDGTNDRVQIPGDFPSGASGEDISIAVWINPPDTIRRTVIGTNNEWILEANRTNNRVTLTLFGGNAVNSVNIPIDEWTHVIAVWDVGTGVTFYINGTLDNSPSTTNTSPDSGGILLIAALSGGANRFKGYLDDIRIYDRLLSAEEASRLYDLGR